MSLMSATLCSRPTSFLRNQHTAHGCVLLTNLKTARIVKGSEQTQKLGFAGLIRFQKLPKFLQMLCSTC